MFSREVTPDGAKAPGIRPITEARFKRLHGLSSDSDDSDGEAIFVYNIQRSKTDFVFEILGSTGL